MPNADEIKTALVTVAVARILEEVALKRAVMASASPKAGTIIFVIAHLIGLAGDIAQAVADALDSPDEVLARAAKGGNDASV